MGSNQNDPAAILGNAFRQWTVQGPHLRQQFYRIHYSVSRNYDFFRRHALGQKVFPRQRRGRKMKFRDHSRQAAIYFLRIWVVDVPAAQTRFHVCHRNLAIERRECGGKRRGCVTLNQQAIKLGRGQRCLGCLKHSPRDLVQALIVRH